MTGRAIEYVFPPRAAPVAGAKPVLEVEGLALGKAFRDVTFTVHAGEVIGLAGLVGSGRSEILETIYGARRATAGTIAVDGQSLRRGSVPAAVRAGIGLCPEERKAQGLLLDEGVVHQHHHLVARPIRACRVLASWPRARSERGVDHVARCAPRRRRAGRADALGREPTKDRVRPMARTDARF